MQNRDDVQGGVSAHLHDAPPEPTSSHEDPPQTADHGAGSRSLMDDLDALIEDVRLYFDAELSYQKSRAGFVANQAKKTVAFGLVAAFFAVLATIGLTVGLIIALTPLVTAWGATAIVVIAWLLVAFLLVRRAGTAWQKARMAMKPEQEVEDHA